MGYAGREFYLCKEGHLTIEDAYHISDPVVCWVCGELPILYCPVNDTNGTGVEPAVGVLAAPVFHECACGHQHVTKSARYTPRDLSEWRSVDPVAYA